MEKGKEGSFGLRSHFLVRLRRDYLSHSHVVANKVFVDVDAASSGHEVMIMMRHNATDMKSYIYLRVQHVVVA